MNNNAIRAWGGKLAVVLATAAVLAGCSDILEVDNPGAITEGELNDPNLIPLIVQGVVGEFQPGYSWYTMYAGTFTDEANDVHVWRENRPIDWRQPDPSNGLLAALVYTPFQRTRAAGDQAAARIRELLGAEAEQHLGVARSLTYSGYALTLLAESYCEAPVNVSEAHSPATLFGMALDRFDDAIGVATAAGTAGENSASADSLTFLAHVGAARAALNRGDTGLAAEYAEPVPANFEFWATYSDNSARENNVFWNGTRLPNGHIALAPQFQGLEDPRIPEPAEDMEMQASIFGPVVHRPSSWSGWEPGALVPIERDTNVRFASGLEARYILAEANGSGARELIDERRAAGGQGEFAGSDDELMEEMRDQRRRDLYLTGHRLGDLRRYMDNGTGDFFPTGPWPYDGETMYGDATCWPIPITETNSNPNL